MMKKIEMNEQKPESCQELWPGHLSAFSYLENLCAVPSLLFAVTTRKENGKPNVCFSYGGSLFSQDGTLYITLSGAWHGGHNYRNITRDRCFVANFITRAMLPGCLATVEHNGDEDDEIAAGGFTPERAAAIDCPRLLEAPLSLECELIQDVKLSEGAEGASLLVGRVRHVAISEDWARDGVTRYGDQGFLLYQNDAFLPETGTWAAGTTATLKDLVKL